MGSDHDVTLSDWVGRTQRMDAVLHADKAAAMAATLDLPPPADGDPLPGGWHWLYFIDVVPRRGVGPDGHPRRGGFLPPVPLPRRMWAGGRLAFHAPLRVGDRAERLSEIKSVEQKQGRGGALVFVTVRHSVRVNGALAIEEEQDLVYREADSGGGGPSATPRNEPSGPATPPVVSRPYDFDPVLLFRYSALTFNGHRIHYDQPYATREEGYRDIVVQGALTATLLMGLAAEQGGRPLARFGFRARSPLFTGDTALLEAAPADGGGLELVARDPGGRVAQSAQAEFS